MLIVQLLDSFRLFGNMVHRESDRIELLKKCAQAVSFEIFEIGQLIFHGGENILRYAIIIL